MCPNCITFYKTKQEALLPRDRTHVSGNTGRASLHWELWLSSGYLRPYHRINRQKSVNLMAGEFFLNFYEKLDSLLYHKERRRWTHCCTITQVYLSLVLSCPERMLNAVISTRTHKGHWRLRLLRDEGWWLYQAKSEELTEGEEHLDWMIGEKGDKGDKCPSQVWTKLKAQGK